MQFGGDEEHRLRVLLHSFAVAYSQRPLPAAGPPILFIGEEESEIQNAALKFREWFFNAAFGLEPNDSRSTPGTPLRSDKSHDAVLRRHIPKIDGDTFSTPLKTDPNKMDEGGGESTNGETPDGDNQQNFSSLSDEGSSTHQDSPAYKDEQWMADILRNISKSGVLLFDWLETKTLLSVLLIRRLVAGFYEHAYGLFEDPEERERTQTRMISQGYICGCPRPENDSLLGLYERDVNLFFDVRRILVMSLRAYQYPPFTLPRLAELLSNEPYWQHNYWKYCFALRKVITRIDSPMDYVLWRMRSHCDRDASYFETRRLLRRAVFQRDTPLRVEDYSRVLVPSAKVAFCTPGQSPRHMWTDSVPPTLQNSVVGGAKELALVSDRMISDSGAREILSDPPNARLPPSDVDDDKEFRVRKSIESRPENMAGDLSHDITEAQQPNEGKVYRRPDHGRGPLEPMQRVQEGAYNGCLNGGNGEPFKDVVGPPKIVISTSYDKAESVAHSPCVESQKVEGITPRASDDDEELLEKNDDYDYFDALLDRPWNNDRNNSDGQTPEVSVKAQATLILQSLGMSDERAGELANIIGTASDSAEEDDDEEDLGLPPSKYSRVITDELGASAASLIAELNPGAENNQTEPHLIQGMEQKIAEPNPRAGQFTTRPGSMNNESSENVPSPQNEKNDDFDMFNP